MYSEPQYCIEPADRFAALPKLGVGLSFQATLLDFVQTHWDAFDFLEIIPDSLWEDRGSAVPSRYKENEATHAFLRDALARKPIVAHSIGLSIGSAERFDQEHIAQMATWQRRYGFPWHSDHLSFNQVEQTSGTSLNVGFTMPVPYDEAVLEMLIERVSRVKQMIPVPFLLENNVYYFEITNQDMSEAAFLNALCARTGCGLLLDLHNVYTNARNHAFDPWDFLGEIDLEYVVEIHIGGGMMVDDFYLDAHSGPCPEDVWSLLEKTLQQAPNVGGVVFEVFGSHYPAMGPDRLMEELDRARAIWNRARSSHQPHVAP